MKLDATGTVQWSRHVDAPLAAYMDGVLEASDGNYVLTGSSAGNVGQSYDKIFAMKLDPSGTELWNFHFNQNIHHNYPYGILETANGDLVIFAQDVSVLGPPDSRPFFARLDSAGALLWAKAYDTGTPGADAYVQGCMEDPTTGNIFFTGETLAGLLLFGAVDTLGNLVFA